MGMPRIDDIVLFVEVMRTLSFTKAGKRLGIPNATVSRRIAAMESRLGIRLFERTTRSVTPTESAQRYYELCGSLVDDARNAQEMLKARLSVPQGHVRASMPVDLGLDLLGEHLPDFLRRHGDITLDVDLSSRVVDLKTEAIDVAIRIGVARGDGLVARRIGVLRQGLYAATGYLDGHGRPRHVEDLKEHRCLHLGPVATGERWRFSDRQGERSIVVRGALGLNSMSLLRRMTEQGLGIARLAAPLAHERVRAGALEPVLPHLAMPGWPVFAVTTSRMQTAAVRAFVSFVSDQLTTRDSLLEKRRLG